VRSEYDGQLNATFLAHMFLERDPEAVKKEEEEEEAGE